MSSVAKYVSSCSRASSLRAAQLPIHCTWLKAPYYSGHGHYSPSHSYSSPLASSIHRSGLSVRYIQTPSHSEAAPASAQSPQSVPEDPRPIQPWPWLETAYWRELRRHSPLSRCFKDGRVVEEKVDASSSKSTVASAATTQETTKKAELPEERKWGNIFGDSVEDSEEDGATAHSQSERALRSTPTASLDRDPWDESDTDRHSPNNTRANPRRNSGTKLKLTPTEYLLVMLYKRLKHKDSETGHWITEGTDKKLLNASQNTIDHFKHFHRLSLQEIVADYIERVDPLLDSWGSKLFDPSPKLAERYSFKHKLLRQHLEYIFSEESIEYLTQRGYTAADVVTWAWVLKSKTPYDACLRMLLVSSDQSSAQGSRRVPSFIPLLLLRQSLESRTFKLLLHYSLDLLTGRTSQLPSSLSSDKETTNTLEEKEDHYAMEPPLDMNPASTLVVRLLHHARELWPQAQLTIAQAFAFYLSTVPASRITADGSRPRLVEICNTILRVLSIPCRYEPFISVSIQQRAQIELLRAMARHQPALPVTKRGYQSLVAIQVAHKKTEAERQSAELKAASWPPWKEDKMGYDVDRGLEGMRSRAMRVLTQQLEAGFSPSAWENMCRILAGWDTDGSPTIQTRSLVLAQPVTMQRFPADSDHYKLWEARIRATRTVREAWACFLSYQEHGLRPHGAIFAAMAEKLIHRQRTMFHKNSEYLSTALPGDGLEVFPEPVSARDWIYVPSEPPGLKHLLNMMLSQGVRPNGRFLALLLRRAPNFYTGLDYLFCSDLTDEQLGVLCTVHGRNPYRPRWYKKTLKELPGYLVDAFVAFLCRFSHVHHLPEIQPSGPVTPALDQFPLQLDSGSPHPSPLTRSLTPVRMDRFFHHHKALPHAIDLLRERDSQPPQAWIHVLSTIVDYAGGANKARVRRHPRRIVAWFRAQSLMRWLEERQIDTGLAGFHALCRAFSRVGVAVARNPDAVHEALEITRQMASLGHLTLLESAPPQLETIIPNGLKYMKRQFYVCVLGDSQAISLVEHRLSAVQHATGSQVTLPPLLHVPTPAVLHAFARTLGLVEDWDGLMSLLRWMRQYELDLKDKYDQLLNGSRIMRKVLIAIRMFLEEHAAKQPKFKKHRWEVQQQDGVNWPDLFLQEAYDIISTSEVWGSWPSDEEVESYAVDARYSLYVNH
ncbi:uncharacterized protein BP01DRAFT_391600 [Aspergillus saccharolyticus JOP 1030-1]|uniref:Prefoldin subunit n=1 Tax=Aspergillus saccharolyticus JOP 1030-1 TaxID=1450539 RepID=A0A318ZD57_9EURO|nr:hypothetical protein BP01DRAFT_391600 [Aspergillus saccharolyticus JOP 1030-1]PYH45431.1 hypothetical protein BP01DRAFT_391600 [Aspergillus saccharolyticus JOP 1030-1]